MSGHPRSNVLIIGTNTVYSLLPATLVSQAEALLLANRVQDAVQVVDQFRKKIQSKPNVDPVEVSRIVSFPYCDLSKVSFAVL